MRIKITLIENEKLIINDNNIDNYVDGTRFLIISSIHKFSSALNRVVIKQSISDLEKFYFEDKPNHRFTSLRNYTVKILS